MATNTDGDIIIGTKLDDSEFQNGLNKMTGIAVKGAAAVAAAIGAMSAAVIAVGSAYETTTAKVNTLVDENVNSIDKISSNILKLSTKSGQAATELSEATYQALSAGISGTEDEITGFVEKASKLAKAGFTSTASAVDIVTTAINGYGLEVGDADSITNQLIMTQNLGKTTVDELSATLGRVIPTASAFSVSLGNVNTSMAIMTASGINTAEASTYLKSMLNELGDTGSDVSEIIKNKTGKSFTQLMGEGKSLGDIMAILGESVGNDSTAFANLWSSAEAGTGALTILNGGTEKYNTTLRKVEDSTTAVDDAYAKVTNTFEEKSKKATNALKNVGIAAYDKFKEPLSKAMDSAQKAIDSLSESLDNGKMGKSIDKIAEGFGKLIEVAIDLASEAIPLLIDGFAFVVDHGELLIGTITALSAAILVYNSYQSVSDGLQIASRVSTMALATAQAVLTGETTLAQGAMFLFNATVGANPVALATAAIIGLTAAVAVLAIGTGEEKTKVQELNDAIDAQTELIKENEEATKKKADAANAEIDDISRVKSELDNLVDANGKVKAGYEERASYLVNELAQATGLDIKLTDGQIENYKELSKEIDKTIEKMRAEATLEAYKEEYVENRKQQKEALKSLNTATDAYNKALSEEARYQKAASDNAVRNGQSQAEAAKAGTEAWQKHVDEAKKALDNAQTNYDDYTKKIVGYEQAKNDILNEQYGTYNELLEYNSSAYAKNVDDKKVLMGQEITDLSTHIETLSGIRTEANAATVDAQIAAAQAERTQKSLDLWALNNVVWNNAPAYAEAYDYLATMGAAAFDANGNLTEEAQAKVDSARNGVMGWAGNYNSALQELADSGEKVYDENGNLTVAAQKKILDAKVKAEELSPQYVDALKKMADEGQSIYDQNGNLTAAAQKKMANAYAKINELSPNYKQALVNVAKDGQLTFDANGNLTDDAKKKVDDACKKIDEQQNSMKTTGKNLANKGKSGFEETDFAPAGAGAVFGIKSGAESGGIATFFGGLASKALNSFKNKLGIKSPSRAFRNLAKWIAPGIAEGVNDNSDIATKSIQSLSDDMLDSFDESVLTNAIGKMDLAIASEQLRMSADSRIQAEYTVGKAVAELKQENQTLKGVLNGELKATMIMDEREVGIIIAPIVSEEIEFNT